MAAGNKYIWDISLSISLFLSHSHTHTHNLHECLIQVSCCRHDYYMDEGKQTQEVNTTNMIKMPLPHTILSHSLSSLRKVISYAINIVLITKELY